MDIMKKNPKGGRPPKSASEKLKERLTVKMAAADYYALRRRGRQVSPGPNTPGRRSQGASSASASRQNR
uniref:hypothetical protein n=1 Tax=Alistipes shahii TaxID=328814 RepID=UPI003219ACB4